MSSLSITRSCSKEAYLFFAVSGVFKNFRIYFMYIIAREKMQNKKNDDWEVMCLPSLTVKRCHLAEILVCLSVVRSGEIM